jgi:hypothetical protein
VSLATLGAILAVTPWAQARDAAEETITLAGRRLRAWDQGSTRWVILDGQAAIFQGTEGLRADRAVVQITETAAGHRLTIYVEAGKDQSPSRRVLETRAPIRLTRYQGRGVGPSHAGESHDRELVARAFPEALSTLSAMERPEVPGHSPPRSFTQIRAQAPDEPEPRPTPEAPRDERVRRTQEPEPAFPELPAPPDIGTPFTPFPDVPQLETPGSGVGELLIPQPPTTLEPLPGEAEVNPPIESPLEIPALPAPIVPGSQRIVNIFLRRNAADAQFQRLPTTENGTDIFVVTGGVTVVAESYGRFGTIDVSADNAIIWTRLGQGGGGPDGVRIVQDANQPLELYLEGNVIFRQDERKVAGHGDEKLIEARQFYMDLRSQRFTALDGQYDQFVADFVAPIRTQGRRIQQFKEEYRDAEGRTLFGPARIQVDRTLTTGSRFPKPGYRFLSRSVDLTEQAPTLLTDPVTGAAIGSKDDPNAPRDSRYLIDARQNLFFIGPIPVFYWPRLVTTSDDIDPPLRRIQFRADNVFGQQLLTDWSGFKLLGLKRPANHVDQWNIDIDYLSYRGLAGGSEFGYFGKDFSKEILGVDLMPRIQGSYFGYIDMWGLRDWGIDNLGNGPAILNNTPATNQIFFRNAVPPLQDFRGRIIARHMHSFNAIDADPLDDTRLQLEFGYLSDRNFLEEYYKRLFDTGMDQATLLYFIRQRQNRAFTFHVEPNLQNFYTDSQWLPKLDYYRLGDAPLWRLFTYYQHSGVNWSNTHTAIEVNNPNVFTFLPLDPVSNTSGPYQSFRAYTAHELDLPINLGFVRLTPYVQGQLVGWTDQLDFEERGRVWGAAGGRLNVFAWKAWPGIESELLNLHGLAHKASFDVDYRTTYADQPLGQLAIQDDLDDNTYEFVRRYFAMTQYVGALLPAQYDPRFLTLRRTISPITGTVDIQDSIETLRLETHQRIQTKRGLEGARRVIDYMTLDIGTTYFPNADRDNFGTPFGQTTYNFEWYLGDRTSFVSSGWFEYFDITGRQLLRDASRPVDAQGINVINAGILVNRPPRGNIYAGYYIINTGPINTSALNGAFGYWLSPKWYGSVSLSYDFGNQILLGTSGSITRVGADFLTSIGLTVDPQRQMYTFGFEIVPRLSPNLRLGSASSGIGRFDSRFAPYE